MRYRRFFEFPMRGGRPFFERPAEIKNEMERLLGMCGPGSGAGVFPLVNLSEDKNNYYVRAELPGIEVGNLDIQATLNTLSLSGERKIAAEDENVKYHRREREAGKFSRVIQLPDAVEPEKIAARLHNGILTVSIPKSDAAKPRQIRIT